MNKNIFSGRIAIIFDFDGTIADTFSLHEKAFQLALEGYGLNFKYSDYTGRSTVQAIEMIFNNNNVSVNKDQLDLLVQKKRMLANHFYGEAIGFIPGAHSFIQLLYQKKIQLYIGSSGSRMNITAGLHTLGIDKYFKAVVTSDDVKNSKPDPEIFIKIISDHGLKPGNVLVIEDAITGITAADAAGLDVLCIDKNVDIDASFTVQVLKAGFDELSKLLVNE